MQTTIYYCFEKRLCLAAVNDFVVAQLHKTYMVQHSAVDVKTNDVQAARCGGSGGLE